MTRSPRLLSVTAAPPPEAVALESDMVVILAALLCALICVVGMLAVARCTCLRRRPAATTTTSRDLNKKAVQSLPKLTYAKDDGGCATTECAICLAEFLEGEEIRVLQQCGHGFHVGCVDTWLGSHSSCPSCRQTPVITKCQKCGRIPAGSVADEGQLKAREDNANLANPSNAFLP